MLQKVTTGTAGDESLYGAYSADTMDGKAGNDYLSGGDDGDMYLFGRGYGQDTIEDNRTNVLDDGRRHTQIRSGHQRCRHHLQPERHQPARSQGFDQRTSDSVTLKNEFDCLETGVFGTHFFDRVEKFQWVDGTIKDITTIVQELIMRARPPVTTVSTEHMLRDIRRRRWQ